jgi:hypothetical protein
VIVAGVVLVVAGLLLFAYQGFTYTTRETVAEVGSLKVSLDKEHSLPSPKTVGGLALGAGVILLIVGAPSAWLSRPAMSTSAREAQATRKQFAKTGAKAIQGHIRARGQRRQARRDSRSAYSP